MYTTTVLSAALFSTAAVLTPMSTAQDEYPQICTSLAPQLVSAVGYGYLSKDEAAAIFLNCVEKYNKRDDVQP